jgi:hypothetical protein
MITRDNFRSPHHCIDDHQWQEILRLNGVFDGKMAEVAWCLEFTLWYFARIAGKGAERVGLRAPARAGRNPSQSLAVIDSKL